MTEEDWNEISDPSPMLEFLSGRASERKLQLFGVACCRRVWHLMTNPSLRHAVEAAEGYADGKISKTEFEEISEPVCELWGALPDATATEWEPNHYMIGATRHLGSGGGAPYAASYAARGLACRSQQWGSPDWRAAVDAESAAQCDLIRDLFGDPTIPFHFDRDWLAGDGIVAVAYAREIYHQGYPDSLALLADLMERAGCRDRAALEHCRGPGPHYRGCWVVDALLEHEPAVRSGLETETDWQTSVHSVTLLHFLRDKGDIRKWRLFAVACCRRMNHLITDPRSQWAVEVATRYADGKVSDEEVEAARSAAQKAQEEAKRAEWGAEADANFCETPTYAAASCHLSATAAARSAICRDPRRTDHEPGSYEASGWHTTHEYLGWSAGDATTANLGKGPGSKPGNTCG